MSIYKQLPKSIDRDLSLANSAIYFFEDVYKSYHNSDYAGSARDHKRRIRKMLAKKQNYIAQFYFKRKEYKSALGRFQDLLAGYRNLGLDATALYGATISALAIKERQAAKKYFDELLQLHPNSKQAVKAKEEVGDEL
jgi:outer membrane protein assembly factor BamD